MITFRKATVADAVSLAPRLRDADRQECWAALGMDPRVVLPLSATDKHCWAVLDEGTPVALFGVSPVLHVPELGIVWMVTAPLRHRHKAALLRDAPKVLGMLHSICPLLGNHVDARNTTHIRWLRHAGFSFLRVKPTYGVERRPFLEFARLR